MSEKSKNAFESKKGWEEKFACAVISYTIIGMIGYVMGIVFEPMLGKWAFAVTSIISLGFAKSACGWKFQ